MLKLVIADDEKIIRETICNFIDWQEIGIEVVGVCSNGVEAYETILDYYPDIVLTDIKMPGLSGLELIQKIRTIDTDIQFIILSGYDNFAYAKEAMQFGVQHYLVKPCNENQIIDAITCVKKDCYKQRSLLSMQKQQRDNEKSLAQNIMKNLIFECISSKHTIHSLAKNYEQLLDFTYVDYKLYYIFYLEKKNLSDCLKRLSAFFSQQYPNLAVHIIYVKNTLIFFFQDCLNSYAELEVYIKDSSFQGQTVSIEISRFSYPSLTTLLDALLPKLKRYEQINLIEHFHSIELLNYTAFLEKIEICITQLIQSNSSQPVLQELNELLSSVSDLTFLKTLITDIFVRLLMTSHQTLISSEQLNSYINTINRFSNSGELMNFLFAYLENIINHRQKTTSPSRSFIDKTISLVDANLANPNLSLKWIAENHLYMNVDYLSKQFIKETGIKFSSYLTTKRIDKAKKLLIESKNDMKISEIAEQIGCGDNPQYFSQLFKKYTGMTPSSFIKNGNN